jgi:hypothetical protein
MDGIISAIANRQLPADKLSLLGALIQEGGTFVPQEGLYWDFKRQWPFSYSDEYFAGIARLVCAFANTHGGIIIFGVHDETRTPGHNKVIPNIDRLEQALRTLLSEQPDIICRRYDEKTPEAIDVLLVCPLRPETLPTRFSKSLGGYRENVIWVRQNSEVIPAEPRHVPFLYCRARSEQSGMDEPGLSGGLPPSPATIKRFVGRLSTIDNIFRWLKLSDEPRTFLYGKGGSGKTTIAYEVAKVLRLEGAQLKLTGGETLDNVIFISAKEQVLNVMSQRTGAFVGLDFTNERELYEAILTLANWTSEPLQDLTLEQIKEQIRGLFDLTSNFAVIDDIDTLTTKGIEAGFDFLYSVLWRSKRRSKILYTIRNAPSQSLANSIEVRGLEGGDYEEFVKVCAVQFGVQPPEPSFVASKLSTVSERRPLVVESIIALRRSAGSYDRAVSLFEEDSGEDVRSYVFQREWNSLPADNQGRYVLAVLALHGTPLAFEDIVALTRYEESRVKDALAAIREMFLVVNEVGQETTFQLGALTTAFVFEQSKRLDLYTALKERVEKYKRSFYPENPLLSRLKDRVGSLIAKGTRFNDVELLKQALQIVNDRSISPKISEDPRFISLQAFVQASQMQPRIDDIRRLFSHVFSMKFEPDIEHLKKWFFVERNSGHGIDQCIKIADFITQGKRYSDEDKLEFLSRKATNLYTRGRNDVFFSPEKGIKDIEESLRLHLLCYTRNFDDGSSTKFDKSEEYARNTAFFLFDFAVLHGRADEFVRIVTDLFEMTNARLDPIEGPLLRALDLLPRDRISKGEAQKRRNKLEALKRLVEPKSSWYDASCKKRLIDVLSKTSQAIGDEGQQKALATR